MYLMLPFFPSHSAHRTDVYVIIVVNQGTARRSTASSRLALHFPKEDEKAPIFVQFVIKARNEAKQRKRERECVCVYTHEEKYSVPSKSDVCRSSLN